MMAANGGEMPEFTAKEMLGYYLKSVAEGEFQIAGTTMGESLDGLVLDLGGPRDGTVQVGEIIDLGNRFTAEVMDISGEHDGEVLYQVKLYEE